jgi:phosphoribosylformylglycinamidine synthase
LPILDDVKRFISRGGWVLGICNGFQILTEAGFLPGALDVNRYKHFLCKTVRLRAERTEQPWIPPLMRGSEWVFPMANGQGRYCADTALEKKLDETGSVAFRYVDHDNGSTGRIAGVNDRALGGTGRVLGLMPHPERNPEEGKRWFRLWLETVGAV